MHAYRVVDSPVGPLVISASEIGLTAIVFARDLPDQGLAPVEGSAGGGPAEEWLAEAERQLAEYFDGRRREFDLPVDVHGTDFQRRLWSAIATIPCGETASYAEIAGRAGAPGAHRAAGSACGANPLAIVVPCHRVVASNGSLRGYGGGLDAKGWLLAHEGALAAARR